MLTKQKLNNNLSRPGKLSKSQSTSTMRRQLIHHETLSSFIQPKDKLYLMHNPLKLTDRQQNGDSQELNRVIPRKNLLANVKKAKYSIMNIEHDFSN